ncbi:MAG TPA: sulfurtransferase [Candidatus Acidoferrales bacterium]|nr:sulfurtransferase [Candidatus Acidoferrales bacterium]
MHQPNLPFVSPSWLKDQLHEPDLTILDVRWVLPDGADQAGYQEAHIPGARFIDLDRELADPPGPPGRHPLPSAERFSKAMQQAGVSQGGRVLAYDGGSGAAARAWWLLRAAGHGRTTVLDGGLAGWRAFGGPVESGEATAEPGDFVASSFQGWVSADQTAELLAAGAAVLDARSHERFGGAHSPFDPRPGHIPGARSLPWTEAYRDGDVVVPEKLVARSHKATGGPAPMVAYCGSGVTACSLILALESAGIHGVLLYPGSWSEWAQDPERPAEV